MGVSRKGAWVYADALLSARGARAVPVALRHGKGGFTLLHNGRALTRCYDTRTGRLGARLVAEALGVTLPPIGASVETTVSTGILYRAVAISGMDPRRPEALPLISRLLEEAVEQRLTPSADGD